MNTILAHIQESAKQNKKQLAVLIDPDRFQISETKLFLDKIHQTIITHIFVGGSTVEEHQTENLVKEIKTNTHLPVILFPGDIGQITNAADAILYLSLISGTNSKYLIESHINSVSLLENSKLEVIPTGYILVESGTLTTVAKVTQTKPIEDALKISQIAKAGQYLGLQLTYLEAGSGANFPVNEKIISATKKRINHPLIVGGGIRSKQAMQNAFNAGADLVVIGTAFEKDQQFYKELLK